MSESLRFEIVGSTGVVYEVIALHQDRNLVLTCSCEAGQKLIACKHRLALLNGETSSIASNNAAEVPLLISWLQGSTIEQRLNEIIEAEKEVEAAKRKVSAAKRALSRVMHGS